MCFFILYSNYRGRRSECSGNVVAHAQGNSISHWENVSLLIRVWHIQIWSAALHPLENRQELQLLEESTTATKPKEDFNDGDETGTKTKSQETSCICNKAKKGCFNISFDFGHIRTLYHDMNQSQVVPSISVQLFNKCFIGCVKLFEVIWRPFFTRI